MSEMIERVALASCSSIPCICKYKMGFTGMPCLERGARAIEAMREPTEPMIDAAWDIDASGREEAYVGSGAKPAWQAMIDECLKT